jgi:hypothetical protein
MNIHQLGATLIFQAEQNHGLSIGASQNLEAPVQQGLLPPERRILSSGIEQGLNRLQILGNDLCFYSAISSRTLPVHRWIPATGSPCHPA